MCITQALVSLFQISLLPTGKMGLGHRVRGSHSRQRPIENTYSTPSDSYVEKRQIYSSDNECNTMCLLLLWSRNIILGRYVWPDISDGHENAEKFQCTTIKPSRHFIVSFKIMHILRIQINIRNNIIDINIPTTQL